MALSPCCSRAVRRQGGFVRSVSSLSRAYAPTPTTTSEPPRMFESQVDTAPKTPRWQQTPSAMKAPFPMDFAKNPANKIWKVNNDPEQLDAMYDRLLGQGGREMLPEEVKWLAVTHKSFDQGRRGFNDKLALLGKLALNMECTKDIVSQPPMEDSRVLDGLGRDPYEHEQLASMDNLTVMNPTDMMSAEVVAAVANGVALLSVMRWKPRLPQNLSASGVDTVLTGGIFAIIGAITLQHGSVVATQVIRDRIMARLRSGASS